MFSGVQLIRTASHQHQRLARVKPVEGVAPVTPGGGAGSSLDGNTQDALARFARFIHKEKAKPKRDTSVSKRKLAAYHSVLSLPERLECRGQYMDISY